MVYVINQINKWPLFLLSIDDEESAHGVLQELWYNIFSGSVNSLRADSRFPRNPDVVNILQAFDSPVDFDSDYGQRLTAYLQVLYTRFINVVT